jgi:hypothetical protein
MPLLPSKKIGGFKVVIGRKSNYVYRIVALGIAVCLLGAAVYGILYASNVAARLFTRGDASGGDVTKFDLDAAQANPRLFRSVPVVELTPSLIPETSPASTLTPIISPGV